MLQKNDFRIVKSFLTLIKKKFIKNTGKGLTPFTFHLTAEKILMIDPRCLND